jgi:FixJ family two-component response regulator
MNGMVYIVDDDASVCRSLVRLLRSEGIQSEPFNSASEFLDREEPEGVGCLLLDVNMPEISGIALQRMLLKEERGLPIVFLTGHGDVSTGVKAMKRGAFDFLTKPVDEAELIQVVRKAFEHHRQSLESARTLESITGRLEKLTAREHEVMLQLITGAPNKTVADHLGIAVKTVKVHRAQVMSKMEVRSAAELVHLCHLVGIDPGPK